MKPFLYDTAQKIYSAHTDLSALTLVFPNRRAILYFRKHLSALLDKPAFSPSMLTIEDFIAGFSTAKVPDKLELVYRLHNAYQQVVDVQESFDQFYFWGEMLLRDFEEVDKYLVNAPLLFKDLSQQKELDALFDYLTEEQKAFLLDFWGNFDEHSTVHKQKFLDVWRNLGAVYSTFREQLMINGNAYEGMLHRKVAEQILADGNISPVKEAITIHPAKTNFIGFNALTKAEEVIISHFVELGSAVYWDIDEYYVNNKAQEAGEFFREYQQHSVLQKTFEDQPPANFRTSKAMKVYGAAQPVGQAKIMSQVMDEMLKQGMVPEETLLVLPDEKLLMPALHGISGSVEKLNVTMGFSLSNTPVFTLVELLIELQEKRKADHFNHRAVLGLLNHPYSVAADPALANSKRKEILKHNWVSIPKNFLASGHDLHRVMFAEAEVSSVIEYLRNVLLCVGSLESISDFDREYVYHFIKSVNRIGEVLGNEYSDLPSFLRFFRQYIRIQKIPFSGEPLQGLQVMGMLETRNLDFKNVFMLSLNEGALPPGSGKGSYIPYSIRKAYRLPTVEHQDAMYAYLFYRILQRAENVVLFYNTETNVLGQGERSRLLQQLMYESGMSLSPITLHNPVQPSQVKPITIQKDRQILDALTTLNEGNKYFKGISPSALNAYIECRLRFYFQHVMKIREADEVEEDMDARVLGVFLHDVMEKFYSSLAEKKGNKIVSADDFRQAEADIITLLDARIKKEYRLDPDKPILYEGQLKLVSEIVKRFIGRILDRDKRYAPFTVEGLEQQFSHALQINQPPFVAVLGGIIDRVDRKDDVVRIVDYKTGRDKLEYDSVESLFRREGERNKAAFQTLLYAWIYWKAKNPSGSIVPGLINSKNLFDDSKPFGLWMKKALLTDASAVMPEFEVRLKELLEELFNPETVFDQTKEIKNCTYCAYSRICYR
jgi:RNAse (barnase) inhibitor barstar